MAPDPFAGLQETPEIQSILLNHRLLADRVRLLEKQLDTRDAFWLRRLWWRIDGWPRWTVVAERRAWRPWHRGR